MSKYFKNLIILIFFLISFFYLILQNLEFNIQTQFMLSFLYISMMGTIIFYYLRQNLLVYVPIFLLSNIYFLFCYVGIFFFDKYLILNSRKPEVFNISDYSYALQVLFYGYLTFLIGYFLSLLIFKRIKRKGFKYLEIKHKEMFILGISLVLIAILFFYIFKIQYIFTAFSQVKYPILLLGIGLLTLFISTNTSKILNLKNITCIFLILVPLVSETLGGSISFPFLVLFLMYAFFSYIKKKIIIAPFLLIFILFIFVHIGKYEFREITWKKTFNQTDQSRFLVLINTYKNIILESNFRLKKRILCTTKDFNCSYKNDYRLEQRIFHSFDSLLFVTKLTKNDVNFEEELDHNFKWVPYWNGYSYKILSTKLIPRIFWKDKPSDSLGNEFGRRYNVLHNKKDNDPIDYTTSWNMPVLNEFYVNFGLKGVIYGMLVIGIFFGFVTKISTFENKNNIESVVLFFLLVPLFFMESHLSLLFGAIIQSYIFLMTISYLSLKILRKIINYQ